MSTNKFSAKDIKRDWHLIDAKNQILGRLASRTATILMGKSKPNYVPYLDIGDNVVIINAAKVKVSGSKEQQKRYVRHSGYPGGLRVDKLSEMRQRKPDEVITHAVKGMIPKTKLGRQMFTKLHVFAGTEHPFGERFKAEKREERNK